MLILAPVGFLYLRRRSSVVLLLLAGASGCHGEARAPASPQDLARPVVIGVNGYVLAPGERGDDGRGQFQMTRAYWEALNVAGARAVHLVPVPEAEVGVLLDRVDGLLVTGGLDIDPVSYGEPRHETVDVLPPERQAFDFALLREALRREMPVLAMCLGAQELNVVLGGTLVQDIPSEVGERVPHGFADFAGNATAGASGRLVAGTPIAAMYGTTAIEVNSAHHQAVDSLGEGLAVAARAPDGVIEAFYAPRLPFVVGLQFHAELQTEPPGLHESLFTAFAHAARSYAIRSRR